MSKTKCPFPSFSLLPPTRLLPHLTMSMQLVECFMRNGNWLPFKTIWVPSGLMMGSVLLVALVFCVVFVFVLFLVPTVACHLVILHCSEVYLVYVTERLASKLVTLREHLASPLFLVESVLLIILVLRVVFCLSSSCVPIWFSLTFIIKG